MTDCGGYGTIYSTFGAQVEVRNTQQKLNKQGAGAFVLHDFSKLCLYNCQLSFNQWSGFGCRWSGAGAVVDCVLESNGQGAWGIRKSTIKDVIRSNNIVKNDNLKLSNYTYFPDPMDTAVKECGLASRGLS